MILRYGVPIGFIATIGFIAAATLLLGQYPSSAFLWWVNQELYCPFRQIFYFFDESPGASLLTALAAAAVIWFFHWRGRKEQAAFLLNNGLLILVLSSESFRWKAGPFASAASGSVSTYLSFALAISTPAACAICALGLSSLLCHYRCIRSAKPGRRQSKPSSAGSPMPRLPLVPLPG